MPTEIKGFGPGMRLISRIWDPLQQLTSRILSPAQRAELKTRPQLNGSSQGPGSDVFGVIAVLQFVERTNGSSERMRSNCLSEP